MIAQLVRWWTGATSSEAALRVQPPNAEVVSAGREHALDTGRAEPGTEVTPTPASVVAPAPIASAVEAASVIKIVTATGGIFYVRADVLQQAREAHPKPVNVPLCHAGGEPIIKGTGQRATLRLSNVESSQLQPVIVIAEREEATNSIAPAAEINAPDSLRNLWPAEEQIESEKEGLGTGSQ